MELLISPRKRYIRKGQRREVRKVPEQCARLINELIELRKAKGWTQQNLARACGLTQAVIGRIESKKGAPTLVTLQKIVAALDATLSVNKAG